VNLASVTRNNGQPNLEKCHEALVSTRHPRGGHKGCDPLDTRLGMEGGSEGVGRKRRGKPGACRGGCPQGEGELDDSRDGRRVSVARLLRV